MTDDDVVDAVIYCGEWSRRSDGLRIECAKPDGHFGHHQSYEMVSLDTSIDATVRYSWQS